MAATVVIAMKPDTTARVRVIVMMFVLLFTGWLAERAGGGGGGACRASTARSAERSAVSHMEQIRCIRCIRSIRIALRLWGRRRDATVSLARMPSPKTPPIGCRSGTVTLRDKAGCGRPPRGRFDHSLGTRREDA